LFRVADLALAVVAVAAHLVLGHLPWSDTSVSQRIDLMNGFTDAARKGRLLCWSLNYEDNEILFSKL